MDAPVSVYVLAEGWQPANSLLANVWSVRDGVWGENPLPFPRLQKVGVFRQLRYRISLIYEATKSAINRTKRSNAILASGLIYVRNDRFVEGIERGDKC